MIIICVKCREEDEAHSEASEQDYADHLYNFHLCHITSRDGDGYVIEEAGANSKPPIIQPRPFCGVRL
jgi:hypothetical protein